MCLISGLATATEHLTFTTGVYIAPLRDLITVARTVGTAAVLSDNRVRLGVGVGWCKEEFDQTGQDFASRGPRLSEMIAACAPCGAAGGSSSTATTTTCPSARLSRRPPRPSPSSAAGTPPWRCAGPPRCATAGSGPGRTAKRRRGPASTSWRRLEGGRPREGAILDLSRPQRAAERRHVPPFRRSRRHRLRCAPWMFAKVEPVLPTTRRWPIDWRRCSGSPKRS